MKKVKKIRFLLCFCMLFAAVNIFAQGGPDPPPTEDPPATPINDWVPFIFVAGVLFVGHRYFRKTLD